MHDKFYVLFVLYENLLWRYRPSLYSGCVSRNFIYYSVLLYVCCKFCYINWFLLWSLLWLILILKLCSHFAFVLWAFFSSNRFFQSSWESLFVIIYIYYWCSYHLVLLPSVLIFGSCLLWYLVDWPIFIHLSKWSQDLCLSILYYFVRSLPFNFGRSKPITV